MTSRVTGRPWTKWGEAGLAARSCRPQEAAPSRAGILRSPSALPASRLVSHLQASLWEPGALGPGPSQPRSLGKNRSSGSGPAWALNGPSVSPDSAHWHKHVTSRSLGPSKAAPPEGFLQGRPGDASPPEKVCGGWAGMGAARGLEPSCLWAAAEPGGAQGRDGSQAGRRAGCVTGQN